jgi:simple sugar transport system permease protein
MKVNKIICRTMFLSAALIGAAGALRVSSVESLSTSITNDVGWTGIIVAWLAKLNPIGIVIVTALITILQCGCVTASVSANNVDSHFADLLQGIILFIILAADFFIRFKIVIRKRNKSEKNTSEKEETV